MVISSAMVWLLVGLLLILTELLATSVIAVFLGLGALAVAISLHLEWVEGLAGQLWIFSSVSLLSLVLARKKLKQFFVGRSYKEQTTSHFLPKNIGARVKVLEDFAQGSGRVELNGVHWQAYSDEPLLAGQIAYITHNDGILLYLSQEQKKSS